MSLHTGFTVALTVGSLLICFGIVVGFVAGWNGPEHTLILAASTVSLAVACLCAAYGWRV